MAPVPIPKVRGSKGRGHDGGRSAALVAAEQVVCGAGIGCLTLDAIARAADLSKGGLLHHFPSKAALIDAMVRREVEGWRAEFAEAVAAQPPAPAGFTGRFCPVCSAPGAARNMRRVGGGC